jgi:hypothetical protein
MQATDGGLQRPAATGAAGMKSERSTHRVVKTLAPTDRGAIELARQYGAALVCVRHRTDAKGKVRHTTVELVVRSTAITPRTVKMVFLEIAPHERDLQAIVMAAGGVWDGKNRLWRLPSRVVTILSLRDRIVGA